MGIYQADDNRTATREMKHHKREYHRMDEGIQSIHVLISIVLICRLLVQDHVLVDRQS